MFGTALLISSALCGALVLAMSRFKLTKRGDFVMMVLSVMGVSLFFSFATVWNMP